MARPPEQSALYEIAAVLREDGDQWFRRQRGGVKTMDAAKQRYTFLSVREVERKLLHGPARGQFDAGQVILLAPPKKEPSAIAALSCRWDFEEDSASCGFYFGLWTLAKAFPNRADAPEERFVAFLGYRFETPEPGDNHNYFHAQPCGGMGLHEEDVAHSLSVSSRMPTFPLAARSSVDLLLCLVLAIYGMEGLSDLRAKLEQVPSARNNVVLLNALEGVAGLATGQ